MADLLIFLSKNWQNFYKFLRKQDFVSKFVFK